MAPLRKQKNHKVLGVLCVESDKVSFSAMSLKDGHIVATAEKHIPLIMAASNGFLGRSRCVTREDDPSFESLLTASTTYTRSSYERLSHGPSVDRLVGHELTVDVQTAAETEGREPPTDDGPTTDGPTDAVPPVAVPPVAGPSDDGPAVGWPRAGHRSAVAAAADRARNKALNCETLRVGPTEPGHVEQDPDLIWGAVLAVVDEVADAMGRNNLPVGCIKSVSVVAEMGSLVAWHVDTGAKMHNVVHWTDARMADVDGRAVNTGAAVAWLRRRSAAVRCARDRCLFGTLDAWVTWKLTAGRAYRTDVSSASCTGLLDVAALDWNHPACRAAGLLQRTWPAVRRPDASDYYDDDDGEDDEDTIRVGRLAGRPLRASVAQPAATLLGQRCRGPGQVAVTVEDRTAVVVCPCDRSRAVAAAARASGVAPVVIGFEAGAAEGPRPTYALMVVTKAPAGLRLGLRESDVSGRCAGAQWRWRRPRTARGGEDDDDGDAAGQVVVCDATDDRALSARVDSVCHTVADMAARAARGAGASRVQRLFVDGQYGGRAALLQRLADVSGAAAYKIRGGHVTCDGAARTAGTVAYADRANPFRYHDAYEPRTTGGQRDEWRREWLSSLVHGFGWAGDLVVGCGGRDLDIDDDDDDLARPPQTLFEYLTSTVYDAAGSVKWFFYRHLFGVDP